MYVKCWMNNYQNVNKTKMLTLFTSYSLKVKHITSSWALKLWTFIVLIFYNNLEMYSYLHNNYITNQQAMNFITTLSWKMDETFELPINIVVTLALGSWPRQGLARLQAKRRSPGVKESVREWTLTIWREFPPWELESYWTPKCLENDCRGENPID